MIIARVIEKEADHVEGSPLMKYTFEVVSDLNKLCRYGERFTKYYGIDPRYSVGKVVTFERI